jgi:hypothetical protein
MAAIVFSVAATSTIVACQDHSGADFMIAPSGIT